MLSLPVRVRCENTLAQGDCGEWMLKHIDRWFAFARRLGLGIEQMEEIILVTGCDCTRSWTTSLFWGTSLMHACRLGSMLLKALTPVSIFNSHRSTFAGL